MGKASLNKGKRGEREVATLFRERGFRAQRTSKLQANRSDGKDFFDVTAWSPGGHVFGVEVKFRSSLPKLITGAWAQAQEAVPPDGEPEMRFVAMRENGGEWLAVVSLEDLLVLLEALYGRGPIV